MSVAPDRTRREGRTWRPIGAGLSVAVIFVAVLSLPLSTAADLGLTPAETTSWLIGVYGLAGFASLLLALRYRQPLLLTGNIFVLFFVDRLSSRLTWSELVGATVVAGVVVLLLGPLGLTEAMTKWLPAPIVFGLLAGLVLDFFVGMFDLLAESTLLVGGTIATFLVARRFAGDHVPAILPALLMGLALAAGSGDLGGASIAWSLPTATLTLPTFSFGPLLAATPVIVLLIAVQANVPSIVYLRSQGYAPPVPTLGMVSGLGTALGSLLGPTGISLSLPATALSAGADAGTHAYRHRSVYLAAGASLGIALFAGVAAQLTSVIPRALLLALVGLAVVDILGGALRTLTAGPLFLGPMFAFGTAASNLVLLGLDALFWALVGGIGVSMLFEREGWRRETAAKVPEVTDSVKDGPGARSGP